jgi:phytoene desaturase
LKRVAIIGSGFGGLALGIRLQSAGISTEILEARDKPGGRAYYWQKDGFVFDAGPTVISDPDCLKQLWALTGANMHDDVDLRRVMPFYRLNWPDGTNFDYSNEEEELQQEIVRLSPDDVAGYAKFAEYSAKVYDEGYLKVRSRTVPNFASLVQAGPALVRYKAWRSVYSVVAGWVRSEHLRQALSFHTLLIGGNPMRTSAIYALIHTLEKTTGVWFPKGGTGALVRAMVTHFERIGGVVRLNDPVVEVAVADNRVERVRTRSGYETTVDAVASNADVVHTYRDLLGHTDRGRSVTEKLLRKTYSPSLFVVHFGLRGHWPDVPHHMIVFGPRYEGLLKDIYENGVLADDFSLYLHHPTITDPDMAPEGCSTFYALAPVPHMGNLAVDWDGETGERFKNLILDEIERRIMPGLRANLVTSFHYTPKDFSRDLNAHFGSAFSIEPRMRQSAWFRPGNRDAVISNLFLVGAGTNPGAGVPGVVQSAKATAALMLADR